MSSFKTKFAWVRAHAAWLALVVLPLVIAACNSGSGSGY